MKFSFTRKQRAQYSWALYDFANTIFSMNVISLYFALWVTQDHHGSDLHYSLVYSGSMLATLLIAPFAGRFADIHHKRFLLLVLSTLLCIASTAMIGVLNRLFWGFIFFFTANLGYQIAMVFYDSLLPSVASDKEYGRVSGLGVALGYLGSIFGILCVSPFVEAGHELMRARAFMPTALFFLVFAIPCFIFVREKKQILGEPGAFSIRENLKILGAHAGVSSYLVMMFLIQNAVTTVILFMSVYSVQVAGFSQKELNLFLILSTTIAFFSAYLLGHWVDRRGPLRVLRLVAWIWIAGLLTAALSPNKLVLWLASFLIGAGLGGLWTASRPLLLALIPEREAATFFGFNVLAGRFSALIGPVVWGMTVKILEPTGDLRYRIAVVIMAFFVFLGWLVSRQIKIGNVDKIA